MIGASSERPLVSGCTNALQRREMTGKRLRDIPSRMCLLFTDPSMFGMVFQY